MAYRSDRQAHLEWRQFTDLFQRRLVTAGIPDEALKTERTWLYFVDHLYLADRPELLNLECWSIDRLTVLLPIFEEIEAGGFHAGAGSGVLAWLQGRVNKGR